MYKIVNSLIQIGIIEKEVGTPSMYKAIPPEEALPMLVKRKQTQISQLTKDTQNNR
jgi:sugar-specific transcriptional regulator TrmB